MVLDKELNPQVIVEITRELLLDRPTLERMGFAMVSLARPDAAERFADLVTEAAS